jgi:uncharacterized protein YbaR (Trm112 family)/ubiquinone/menaquinone biosynthesis C-methylase UbiE
MQLALLDVLRCPACAGPLDAVSPSDGLLVDGRLDCPSCGRAYPVERAIPRLLPEGIPGLDEKLREIEGWSALAQAEGWYTPDDRVDAVLPYVSRDLGWDDANWEANEHSFSLLLDEYVRPGARVLEVGAAKCWAAQHLVPLGCRYVGTDLVTDENIGLGRGEFFERRVGRFDRVQADGERLPFADGSFDLSFCVATLHHAVDLGRMVRELARVTRRGGVVAALNEGTRSLRESPEAPDQAPERSVGINEHVHTLPAYLWAFVRAGLVVRRIERSDGYSMFAGRKRVQKVLRLPGGRTALTAAFSLFMGYHGVSLYARRRSQTGAARTLSRSSTRAWTGYTADDANGSPDRTRNRPAGGLESPGESQEPG